MSCSKEAEKVAGVDDGYVEDEDEVLDEDESK